MAINDPFSEENNEGRTVIRPRPGGHRRPISPRPSMSKPLPSTGYNQSVSSVVSLHGVNPLVAAANVLLLTAGQLRDTTSHPDPDMLHNLIVRALTDFESSALSAGEAPKVVFTARYLLCTFVDEIVLSTPWGSQSDWSQHTLLSKLHNEVGGGEEFFQILNKLLKDPASNLALLELIYICLALGFKGKYRIQSGGVGKIEGIQNQLMNTFRKLRNHSERELSPNWRGAKERRNPLARYVPLWVVGVLSVAVLLLIWFVFSVRLSTYTSPVIKNIQLLGQYVPATFERAVALPEPVPIIKKIPSFSVAQALKDEIKQRLVDVNESESEVLIVVRGESLFAPSRATLTEQRIPLIQKIALILERLSGPVLVTGHTDNIPIGGSLRLKFPTNWDLSQKRAESVASLLKKGMSNPNRVIAEGLADTNPLVVNDSRVNRALNRRVEITLKLLNDEAK